MKFFYFLLYLLVYFSCPPLVCAGIDSVGLQRQAVERIEKLIHHFRKTGDYASQVGELQQAQKELTDSYKAFIRDGANGSAALSLIKLGDVQRMQDKWQEAIKYYQQGYDLAKRADHVEYQARALLGHAKTEKSELEEAQIKGSLSHRLYEAPKVDYSQALKHSREAVQLANNLDDKGLLLDTLNSQANVETKSGDLDAAMSTLNLAFSVNKTLGDETRLLYAYLYRGDVNYNRLHKCTKKKYPGNYKSCDEAANEAKSDYEQALALAKRLEYAGLATYTEGFLQDVEKQRCMVAVQECDQTSLRNVNRDLPYTEPEQCCKKCPPAVLRDLQHDVQTIPALFERFCGESFQ